MSDSHEIIQAYIESTSIAQQQIDSYNRFISVGINRIVENQSIIEPEVSDFAIKLERIRLEQPVVIESDSSTRMIMPHEAQVRNLTYSAPMYISYTPLISGIAKADSSGDAYVGEMPVMVRSNLCYTKNMSPQQLIEEGEDPDDPGGYFIIKGTERVLVGIEDLAPNKMMTTKEKNETVTKVFSTTLNFRAKCTITRDEYGIFTIMFPTLSKELNLVMVLRALGMQSKEMLDLITNREVKNDFLLNIELSKAKDLSSAEAMSELGKITAPNQAQTYQEKRAEMQLDTYILPHLGTTPQSRADKALYLVRMAERTSMVAYNYVKSDDKDHYANKRVKLAGDLMEELFNTAFKAFVKDIKYHVERTTARGRKLAVKTNINPDTLTEKILYSMSTGSWPAGQTGVSQVLDRFNFASSVAHIRRVKSPLAKRHPHFKARDVHGTHLGKICISETPEGIEVGLTRYLALMSKVTVGADHQLLEGKLKELKLL
ncbi:MAG: DNA-directed RNA polymerase subunit B'' [Candidatus Marsarchaeota archaeon]|jgi:DNA-directed RNA polymerase beta subunit|nr:DNA-directed RNA polymerase subunit B'' [Candidatus Marsarchaeota archaeon]